MSVANIQTGIVLHDETMILPDWWALWPKQPYQFGEALAFAAQALLPEDYPLRNDLRFIEDFSGLLLRTVQRLAKQEIDPAVDCIVIEHGAGVAVGRWRPYDEQYPAKGRKP